MSPRGPQGVQYPAGAKTYVFPSSFSIPVRQPNGDAGLRQIFAGQPVILTASEQSAFAALGLTLPAPQ